MVIVSYDMVWGRVVITQNLETGDLGEWWGLFFPAKRAAYQSWLKKKKKGATEL